MIAIPFPPEVEARLDELARQTGRTKAFFVQQAVVEHLADLEDIYLAETRLAQVQAGASQTFSLADVERDLGLAD